MNTASRLFTSTVLVLAILLGTGLSTDAAASPTPRPTVLRDQLFKLEHLIHALQAEIESLEARLARLEARVSHP